MMQAQWTADEDATLRGLYATRSAGEIGKLIGRTRSAVKNRVHALGLSKESNGGRFVAGQESWNKGKHYVTGGRSAETRFKKGNRPHTWRPIGSTRTTKDGYLERKTSDTGVTRHDFVGIHHLVWRMHGGTVPRGHALTFRDGNPENLDINNLELVTRQELMSRNTVHRLPPDVARAVQLIGALRRQINKREGVTA